tara:strand:- start:226909 stop:228081 length:1173 start_codon:yes stop_codon:yes gene_type:complete
MSVDRRKRGVWAMIIDDPYRKMVAIGLAVLLWFFIDSRIMDSETFTLPLTAGDQMRDQDGKRDSSEFVVFLPSGVIKKHFFDGDAVATTIEVKMSGPRYRIDRLKNDPLRLRVMSLLGRQWNRDSTSEGDVVGGNQSDVEFVEITAADIERDIRHEDLTIELIPPRIRIEVEVRDTVTVDTILPSMVEFVSKRGDHSRMRTEKATFSPRGITLVGPAKIVRSLLNRKDKKPFQAELSFGPQDTSATATITVVDGVALEVYPDAAGVVPQVTIPLAAVRKTYTLNLPLVVRDKRADQSKRYEADEKVVPVSVSFSGSLGLLMQGRDDDERQKWATQNLRLEVYLNDLASGVPLGPELQLSPWILLDGPLLHRYPNNEYWLEESLTVTMRAK